MFKSFFANQGLGPDFSEVSAWAKRRTHQFFDWNVLFDFFK